MRQRNKGHKKNVAGYNQSPLSLGSERRFYNLQRCAEEQAQPSSRKLDRTARGPLQISERKRKKGHVQVFIK